MPLYDYQCANGHPFEVRHGFSEAAPPCPVCGEAKVERRITTAPAQMRGMAADAGRGGTATKEQINSKWAEETPKLREQLVSKLGEDMVSRNLPELNPKSE